MRILLADDNPGLRSALRLLLETRLELELISEARDMEHVLAQWRAPLKDVSDEELERPEYLSRWITRYCIDAMLEHAVMHPIRHAFQLEELMHRR